jgi:hypothetical protein
MAGTCAARIGRDSLDASADEKGQQPLVESGVIMQRKENTSILF